MRSTYPLPYQPQAVTPFITAVPSEEVHSDAIHIIGFPFDGTTSFRPGSRLGPSALREASLGLESYSPYLRRDLEDLTIYDLGNLPFYPSKPELIHQHFWDLAENIPLKEQNIRFLFLGGEHSISLAPLKVYLNQYPDLVLIHLDAHTDLRESFLMDRYSHASIIRRALDFFGSNHRLLQYGIRSGTAEEFQWMEENKTLMRSLNDLLKEIEAVPDHRPIYLTLDLDFFDPAYLPGTGTPEAGGEDFHSFMKIVKLLTQKNLVGADVVELAPMIDPTGNSNCFASKIVRELLLAFR